MFSTFSLTLMVNHACNLRCTYCYTGEKLRRPMSDETAVAAIDRAVRSVEPAGRLELGFFGGEPLLEAESILEWVETARVGCDRQRIDLLLHLTTNGTMVGPSALRVMELPEMRLSVSHDGLPDIHDRHRRSLEGHGSSASVLQLMQRLTDDGRDFNVVMVVRPDTVARLAEGMDFLRSRGVRLLTPSLDLWTIWSRDDAAQLEQAVIDSADLWRQHWPDLSIGWFDEKAARVSGIPLSETARCTFGNGQIAVSPAGYLYPCERLIGEDRPDNPMRLPGHVLQGPDYCGQSAFPSRSDAECDTCVLREMCGTSCRCSNFVRTGDVAKPDGLLCWLETLCFRETTRVLNSWPLEQQTVSATVR